MSSLLRRIQKSNLWLAVGAIILGGALFAWTSYWKKLTSDDNRILLSSLNLTNPKNGDVLQIVKLREKGHLAVEVFRLSPQGAEMIQRLDFRDQKDAYFRFRETNSNLLLQTVEPSGEILLLVPGYDEDLVAHLNAFVFNTQTSEFTPLESDSRVPLGL